MKETNYFRELSSVDVGDKTESKNGLTYLSWAWAWSELKKRYPMSTYKIYETADGCFYHTDGKTCWVKTGVTVTDGATAIEHIEYLPVMDYRNKSITLDKVTSTDVNKAIQRSLTKAVARHGLGLYIYAGEDLPEDYSEAEKTPDDDVTKQRKSKKTKRMIFAEKCNEMGVDSVDLLKALGWNPNDGKATDDQLDRGIQYLDDLKSGDAK